MLHSGMGHHSAVTFCLSVRLGSGPGWGSALELLSWSPALAAVTGTVGHDFTLLLVFFLYIILKEQSILTYKDNWFFAKALPHLWDQSQ